MAFSVTNTTASGSLVPGEFGIARHLDTNFSEIVAELNQFPTNGALRNGSVDADILATDAVETAKIKDLNVTTDKLADGAVTAAKLHADAISVSTFDNAFFGDWTTVDGDAATLVKGTTYQANGDGFITAAQLTGTGVAAFIRVYTGDTEEAVTSMDTSMLRTLSYDPSGQAGLFVGVSCPVRKNEYVRLDSTASIQISWIPLGIGVLTPV